MTEPAGSSLAVSQRSARRTETAHPRLMPLRAHHLPPRSIAPNRPTRAVFDLPFDDLVYLLAAGVADAQAALDAQVAETLATLAETEVDVVPSLTRTIEPDGSVTTDAAPPERRSLLDIGLTPARYRFSDATIEVEVDVSVAERDRSEPDGLETERADRTPRLRAGTQSVIDRRTFDREAGANARLAARLEPTPLPAEVAPSVTGDDSGAADGGDHAD